MTYPFAALLTIVLSSTFSPGPNNIMCMTLGQKYGFKKTLKYIIGALLGYLCLLILLALLNAVLYKYIPAIKYVMGIFGALYLSYMAWKIYHSSSSSKSKSSNFIAEDKLFLTGMYLQFINPKAVLFGITILSTFAFPYFQDFQRIGLLIISLVFFTSLSLCTWASFGSLLNNFVKNNEKVFNIVMALILLYCAYVILDPISLIKAFS